ncbi:MAG: hypothetical protein EAX90_14890 [Candidatus Heimdallarchaeota archaeon]|nr:hypothetical protein [Candidatus Heimdallarchaeota archaeon]
MVKEKNKQALSIKNIQLNNVFLGDSFKEYFFNDLLANPVKLIKYQFTFEKVGNVIFCFLPIINYSFGSSKIIFRVYVFNQKEKITYKYGVDTKPIQENIPKLDGGSFVIPTMSSYYFDIEFKDLTIIDDYIYLSIGKKEKEIEKSDLNEKSKNKYLFKNFKLPVTRIVKPQSFDELVNLRFVGLTTKPYIDIDSIGDLLRHLTFEKYDFIMELILVVCCCALGIGLCYLPFYITNLTQMKKKYFAKEDLVTLQLTDQQIVNPSKEWLRAVKKQRKQVVESLENLNEEIKHKRISDITKQLEKIKFEEKEMLEKEETKD